MLVDFVGQLMQSVYSGLLAVSGWQALIEFMIALA